MLSYRHTGQTLLVTLAVSFCVVHTPWSHLPPPAPLFHLPRTRPSLIFTPAPFLQPLNPTWQVLLVWPYPCLVQVTMATVMSGTQHFTAFLLVLQLHLLSFPSYTMPSNHCGGGVVDRDVSLRAEWYGVVGVCVCVSWYMINSPLLSAFWPVLNLYIAAYSRKTLWPGRGKIYLFTFFHPWSFTIFSSYNVPPLVYTWKTPQKLDIMISFYCAFSRRRCYSFWATKYPKN